MPPGGLIATAPAKPTGGLMGRANDPFYPTPPGYAAMLERNPDFAVRAQQPGTRQNWPVDLDLLRQVNQEINAAMPYRPEQGDTWGKGADCEDIAIAKMEALLAAGVPREDMRLGVTEVNGRGHAMLIVRGNLAMDNTRGDVFRLDQSPLRMHAMEGEDGKWHRVIPAQSLADHLEKR